MEARTKAEADSRARANQEAKLRAEAEARAAAETVARIKAEEETKKLRQQAEEDARRRANAEARANEEANARAKEQLEVAARLEAEKRASAAAIDAERRGKYEAEARAKVGEDPPSLPCLALRRGRWIEAQDPRTGRSVRAGACYLTYVALNSKGRPTPVPKLLIETAEEKRRFRQASIRRRLRDEERAAIEKL